MKEKLIDFLKGIIIGIANILPGFSGGVMAVAFNVYDRLIHAISNILSKPIKVIKDIWALGAGVAVGILIAIVGISLLLTNFPIPTIFFFTGLIVGSIPNIYEKTKDLKFNYKKVISFFIGFGFIIGLLLFSIFYNGTGSSVVVGEVDVKQLAILFFVGIIASATMIIPGVSGSLVLLAIGYYQYIIDFIMNFLKAALAFDFSTMFSNALLVGALGLGIVVGMLVLSKVIEKLIDKYPTIFYTIVFGLLVASPFAIIYQLYIEYKEAIHSALILNWLFGIIFLVVGVITSHYISKSEQKQNL